MRSIPSPEQRAAARLLLRRCRGAFYVTPFGFLPDQVASVIAAVENFIEAIEVQRVIDYLRG